MATIEDLKDPYWRLNNLYYIKNKSGQRIQFKMNWAQDLFYKNMWYLNLLLKARQIGMTTIVQILMLDRCLFNSNTNAGVIAHNREDAQKFFQDKIKFAYDNLPEPLKAKLSARSDSARELSFSNGSSIRVGTSLRSATLQYLHISEFGKICAQRPDRAEEIITGSLETVAAGQFVFIESTAEGDYGRFYELCQQFENFSDDLTKLDYRFFFFPWWKHPDYILEDEVKIPSDLESYFLNLENEGILLTQDQKAWYTKKKAVQKSKMKREYPSTPQEAFEQISEYAVYGEEIGKVLEEERFCQIPVKRGKPVDLFLDIGKSTKGETTCAWFLQYDDPWFNWIDYYQNSLKPVSVYVSDIRSKGYSIGKWYIPHDAGDQKDYAMKTFRDRLIEAGISRDCIVVVPRVSTLTVGIDMVRDQFPAYRFDRDRTKEGWKALKAYRYEWDAKKSITGQPIHDWASHPSDALRQCPQGWKPNDNSEWFNETINYPKSTLA